MAGVKWCLQEAAVRHVMMRDMCCAHTVGADWNKYQITVWIIFLHSWRQTSVWCTHTVHLHVADGVSHFLVICSSQIVPLFFLALLYFFLFTLSCRSLLFFCWVSSLLGFTQRNQFCLASLLLERNIGIYKYSHAAISDPQLRDWSSGWAVLLFDHEACIHLSLNVFSLSLRILLFFNFLLPFLWLTLTTSVMSFDFVFPFFSPDCSYIFFHPLLSCFSASFYLYFILLHLLFKNFSNF